MARLLTSPAIDDARTLQRLRLSLSPIVLNCSRSLSEFARSGSCRLWIAHRPANDQRSWAKRRTIVLKPGKNLLMPQTTIRWFSNPMTFIGEIDKAARNPLTLQGGE